jgi:hypothetical protein
MGSYKGRALAPPSMRFSQARPCTGASILFEMFELKDCRPRPRGVGAMRDVTSDSFSHASSRSSVDPESKFIGGNDEMTDPLRKLYPSLLVAHP